MALSLPLILTGGQTGVDLAATRAAIAVGLPWGGWVPHGRTNEDGPIPKRFEAFMAAPATEPIVRTRLNVEAADALLVVTDGAGSQGTDAAIRHARGHARPVQVCDLGTEPNPAEIATFCGGFGRVNVAGPRRSELAGGRAAEERIENLFLKSFQRLLR